MNNTRGSGWSSCILILVIGTGRCVNYLYLLTITNWRRQLHSLYLTITIDYLCHLRCLGHLCKLGDLHQLGLIRLYNVWQRRSKWLDREVYRLVQSLTIGRYWHLNGYGLLNRWQLYYLWHVWLTYRNVLPCIEFN